METENKAAFTPQPQSLAQYLKRLEDRVFAWSASFVTGRYWMLRVLLFCVAFSVWFVSGFDYYNLKKGYPESYYAKVQHPLLDMAKHYPPASHDAKLTYRLTVPVLLHPLGLSPDAARNIVLPVLSIIGTCAVILFSCLVALRITGDRVTGFFMALNVCATYVGSFANIGFYDSIAMTQLILAMLPGLSPTVLGMLVFSASFTDERAFLACGLLLVREFCLAPDGPLMARLRNGRVLSIVLGMAAYWLVRLLLAFTLGLTTTFRGTGLDLFIYNIQFWHPGAWFALKGGWLLVFLAALVLWRDGQRAAIWALLLPSAMIVTLGFMVADVTRSTAYVYPVVFIALSVICRNEKTDMIRRCCLLAALISILGGDYDVFVDRVTWSLPYLVQFINELALLLHSFFIHASLRGTPA